MPAVVGIEEMLSLLKQTARAHGLHCRVVDHEGLRAELESTQASWFFGGRKVTYYLGCQLDEARRVVQFREMVKDTLWGFPVPLSTEVSPEAIGGPAQAEKPEAGAGPGPIEYFRIREAIEHAVREAGWQFSFEPGRP